MWGSKVRTVRVALVTGVVTLTAAFAMSSASAGRSPLARSAALAPTCANPELSTPRDASNPLALPVAPGFDPLHGAHFFVDGPAHGTVAKGIEQLIGDTTTYPDTESWATFEQSLNSGALAQMITSPSTAQKVKLLEKIGDQEETNNLSEFSRGGGPGAVFAQTMKIMCQNMLADPTPSTVPVFSTFFVYPHGMFCPSWGELFANQATFKRQINEMAAATGGRRAVFLLEIDSVGASGCMTGKTLRLWLHDLLYEIVKMSALPHTVVYQEAGSSDEGTPHQVATLLDHICVVKVHGKWVNKCALMRGFWTNGTHFNWSMNEIGFGEQVSKLLDKMVFHQTGQHYHAFQIINTAQNGKGPLKLTGKGKHGVEYLCNPTGRGLGRQPTASTAPTFDGHVFDGNWPNEILDGFLWSGVPGRSHSTTCYPGAAPAGVFDLRFALELSRNANQQLGPGSPSLPY